MNSRVLTGAIFAILLLAVLIPAFVWPLWTVFFLLLVGLFLALEYHQAMQRIFRPLSLALTLSSVAVSILGLLPLLVEGKKFRGWQFIPSALLPPLGYSETWQRDYRYLVGRSFLYFLAGASLLLILAVVYTVLSRGAERLPQTVTALAPLFYIAFPLMLVSVWLFALPNGYRWIFLAFFLPCICDVGAYYGGRFFGKTPFFHHLSPKKTWEGAAAGLALAALVSGLYFLFFLSGNYAPFRGRGLAFLWGLISGALIAVAGELGDLFASALKRWSGIKDFSSILPGHGGLLDRFDSILFALPLSFFLSLLYYAH